MSTYINPHVGTKEQWLLINATQLSSAPENILFFRDMNQIPVCLVDNGIFTAAGICSSQKDINDFSNPRDKRPKVWFLAPVEQLEDETVSFFSRDLIQES